MVNPTQQLDDRFLANLGLEALAADEKRSLLDYINNKLAMNIGDALADDLTEEQLQEFDDISGDLEAEKAWLDENCPQYKEVVKREVAALEKEVIERRPQLLGEKAESAS